MTCEGIEHLDQQNSHHRKTLRELIVGLPNAHFINVDLNWTGTSYAVLFPTKYEADARDMVAYLGPYLHKAYGDHILPSLPAKTQASIAGTTWNEETGRPVSTLDLELDEIIEEDGAFDFVDLSLLEDTTDRTPPVISTTFQPKLDDTSVSTFGGPLTTPEKRSSTAISMDNTSVMSEVTI